MEDNKKSEDALYIVTNLLEIGVYLHRVGNRIASEFDLNQLQFVVLNEIVKKTEINQKQLVSDLIFEKSNVSKIIKKLKSLDYIEVSRSNKDGRITVITVTDKGKNIWDLCMEKFNAWNRNWVKTLKKDDIDNMKKVLDQIKNLQ